SAPGGVLSSATTATTCTWSRPATPRPIRTTTIRTSFPESMSRRISAILLAALLLLPFPFSALAQQLQPVERIAAIVDEDVILRSELDLAVRNILAQYAGRENQLPPRPVLERQVLERLVLVRLQVARARSMGIRVNDQEISRAVATIAQQNGMTVEGLRERLAA